MKAFVRWGVLALLLAGCTGDDSPASSPSLADVLVAVISAEAAPAADATVPASSDGAKAPLPVVYVASSGEQEIDAGTQAKVAEALRDEVDVRFADSRDEAIDTTLEDEPVRDDGVLIAVSEWPEEFTAQAYELLIDVYRSASDRQRRVVTVAAAGDDTWAVASTSIVPTTTLPPTTTAA